MPSEQGVAPGDALPLFELPDRSGNPHRLWAFKQRRPVVLYFAHSSPCAACDDFVVRAAKGCEELAALNAVVIILFPGEAAELPATLPVDSGRFLCVADSAGMAGARYLGSAARDEAALVAGTRYLDCAGVWRFACNHVAPDPDLAAAELRRADIADCGCALFAWEESE